MSTTRSRVREPAPAADTAPEPTHTAKLVRGNLYILTGRDGAQDQTFLADKEVAVDQATFDHLATHALDVVTFKSGGDSVSQTVRKFRLADPAGRVLPKVASEEITPVGGTEPEPDPYQ